MSIKTQKNVLSLEKHLEEMTLPGQKEAITATEPLVVVSAGAGTGKTWTLAWRFIWAVATGRASVKQILTLTFTEKAAREMKERISSILEMLEKSFPSRRSTFSNAREQLDEAYISTIHSFAMRVIRESSLDIPIDPEARPVSPPDEGSFWRDVEENLDILRTDWFTRRISDEWKDSVRKLFSEPAMEEILNFYGAQSIADLAAGSVSRFSPLGLSPEKLYDWGENIERHDEDLGKDLARILEPDLKKQFELWLGTNGIFVSLDKTGKEKTSLAKNIDKFIKTWGQDVPSGGNLINFIKDLAMTLKGARGELKTRINDLLEEDVSKYRAEIMKNFSLFDFIQKGCSSEEIFYRKMLLKLTSVCWKIWQEEKARRGLISFDDMMALAHEAVRENNSYSERFCEILLDEFQDTNEIQDEFVRQIWDPETQRLFLVGDLKQSIYGFRQAEPQLFLQYIKSAQNWHNGRYINLDTSFRSSDQVLRSVNDIFAFTWKEGLGDQLRHPYEPLVPPLSLDWHEKRQKTDLPAFSILLRSGSSYEDGECEKIETLREDLARRLGTELMEMINTGKTVWDKEICSQRELSWKDIAILVPSRTHYPCLEKVLVDEFSLPIYFVSSTGYYSRSETLDIVALLEFLQDKTNSTALAHFLSSPLSGMTLEEVKEILETTLPERCPAEKMLFQAGKYQPGFEARLTSLSRKAVFEGPSKVIEEIISDGQILAKYPPWLRKRAAANIRKAIDIVREYETCRGRDLEGCVEYLTKSAGRGIRLEEAPVTGEDEDVIRVMTVHAAKGLEFPVLALFGIEQSPTSGGKGTSLQPSPHMGTALSGIPQINDGERADIPLSSEVFRYMEKKKISEEWQRLFYVACTRARDSLLLCGTVKRNKDGLSVDKGSWLSLLSERSGGIDKLPFYDEEEKRSKAEILTSISSDPYRNRIIELPNNSNVRLEKVSATSFALYRFCPYAYRMKFMQGMDLDWELPGEERSGGSDMGTLAHWMLQKWDFRTDTVDQLIPVDREGLLERKKDLPFALHPVWEKPYARNDLRDWLLRLCGTPLGIELARLSDSKELHREFPFSVGIGNGTRLVGSVDVMWVKNNIIHVRDYKITAVKNTPEILYEEQMRFYGLALKKRDASLKQDIRLYHLREGIESEGIPSDNRTIENTEKLILDMAYEAALGNLPPARDKCDRCPFRKSCTNPCSEW